MSLIRCISYMNSHKLFW